MGWMKYTEINGEICAEKEYVQRWSIMKRIEWIECIFSREVFSMEKPGSRSGEPNSTDQENWTEKKHVREETNGFYSFWKSPSPPGISYFCVYFNIYLRKKEGNTMQTLFPLRRSCLCFS
ncbi:hypothetical protein PMAC_000546 [Pneumocystis sp. 'macacae']|nr:hypothetical protein PMAC_000546 [Pneumocystis sp. 'macacae']